MDRIVLIIADSIQLQRSIADMTSQVLKLLPPPSGGSLRRRKAVRGEDDGTKRRRQERRQTTREDADRYGATGTMTNEELFDEDKENDSSVHRSLGLLKFNAPVRPLKGWFDSAGNATENIQCHTLSTSRGTQTTNSDDWNATITLGRESMTSSSQPEVNYDDGSKTSVWLGDSDSGLVSSIGSGHFRRNRDERPPPTLCDVSLISHVSANSLPREQISSIGDYFDSVTSDHVTTMSNVTSTGPAAAVGAAFHSTFNYPLHSTLRSSAIQSGVSSIDDELSGTMNAGSGELSTLTCSSVAQCHSIVDRRPPHRVPADRSTSGLRRREESGRRVQQQQQHRYDDQEARVLRRQTGQTQLEREDEERDDEDIGVESFFSMHATCGSLPDLNGLSKSRDNTPLSRRNLRHIADEVIPICRHRCTSRLATSAVRRPRGGSGAKRCRGNDDVVEKRSQQQERRKLDVDGYHDNVTVRSRRSRQADHRMMACVAPSLLGNGCLPLCGLGNDAAVVRSRRRQRLPVKNATNCERKRSLASKLKKFGNLGLLCSSAAQCDTTRVVTNLGNL